MYVLGIDGGQTGTTCLLADSDGSLLGRGTGGHLIHLAQPGGEECMRAALQQAIGMAWQTAGLEPQHCATIYLGLTGVETPDTPEAAAARRLSAELVTADTIIAANDATSALAGALLGAPGVVVIAGTGAIALGMNEAGQQAFSGGWGWLLGDEGSATYLGRCAVLAALRSWDGRGAPTALLPLLREHYQLEDFYGLKRLIYSSPMDSRLFADLAPIVVTAAQQGDAVALTILADAGKELAQAVSAVVSRLGFTSDRIPVAPLGGVWRAGELILKPFKRHLRRLQPRALLVAPILPASCGSVLLALKACGAFDVTRVNRLLAQAQRLGWANLE